MTQEQAPEPRPRRWRTPALIMGAGALLAAAVVGVAVVDRSGSAATPGVGTLPLTSSSGTSAPVSTKGFPSGAGEPGIFTDRCAYSHEAADDPILAPNAAGQAMHHNFYGNVTTSAASTAASLIGKKTTCTTTADASAYWTPVMYQGGRALTPGTALIYWRRPPRDTEAVQTFPAGLQLIAGNEAATAPQSLDVVAWSCTGAQRGHRTTTPRDCPAGAHLRVTVTFPSCWDGHTLSGRGQTNVVYRPATGCPSSHPVQIPQVVFHVTWPTSSAAGLTLSMTPTMQGSTNTMHVDLINGWTQNVLDRDVAACDATSTRCGPVSGPGAAPQGPAKTPPMRRRHK